MQQSIRIGTAGWSIPGQHAASFPTQGTHLERYARSFSATEINSSFYRRHRPATYMRWAASVPPGFQFAVKLPREITHRRKLADATEPLDAFVCDIEALGPTLGPLLVQLPPSLAFDRAIATTFLRVLRARFEGAVVCEPRHATWFTDDAEAMLAGFEVARVAADPSPVPQGATPGGWAGLTYHRLHGSPDKYRSAYSASVIDALACTLGAAAHSWCVFDNTTLGEATKNALELMRRIDRHGQAG